MYWYNLAKDLNYALLIANKAKSGELDWYEQHGQTKSGVLPL